MKPPLSAACTGRLPNCAPCSKGAEKPGTAPSTWRPRGSLFR